MICANCQTNINDTATNCAVCDKPLHSSCEFKCVGCGRSLCDHHALQNKYKCRECLVVENVTMECISSTMFESYLKCGYSFKHEYVLKTLSEKERNNKYAALGTLLHNLFDKYSYIRPLDTPEIASEASDLFLSGFNEIDEKLFTSEEDIADFKSKGLYTLLNFLEFEKDRPTPMLTEQQHFFKVDGIDTEIRSTFDRINGDKDDVANWVVEDYKTGKVYSSDNLNNNMQLPIYALAIKTIYGEYPKTLRLIFPQHLNAKKQVQIREFNRLKDDVYVCDVFRGGTYIFSVSEKVDKMREIYDNIKVGNFPFNTSNSKFCSDFCSLGKSGHCTGTKTKWLDTSRRLL